MTSLISQADALSPEFWRLTALCRVLDIKDHCTDLKTPSRFSVDELRKWREKLEQCSDVDSISFLVAESNEVTVTDWFAVILSILFDEWELRELCFSMISVDFPTLSDKQSLQHPSMMKRLESIRQAFHLCSREERELLKTLLSTVCICCAHEG